MAKHNYKIDRRDFLKIGSAGAISALILNKFNPLFADVLSSGKNVSFTSKEFRNGIPSVCNLCPAHCGILGFVQNDYLAGIQGNPRHPNNKGKICARGIAGMNIVYDPQRILFPLKRDGERGSGKWKQIAWGEAIDEISSHLENLKTNRRSNEFIFLTDSQISNGFTSKIIASFGGEIAIENDHFHNRNKAFAQKITWGEESEIIDIENARYILNFGANPLESQPYFINFSQRLIQAKLNGAQLITIDPRLSNTAAKSDQWIPIKPGTDAVVLLAMANVIMKNNLFDGEFISRWTNVSVNELKNYLSQFTLENAEAHSTIPAATIDKIAIDFATNKPAVAFSGSGISNHANGSQNERCVMLLNAIVGNIDSKGGFCLPQRYKLDEDIKQASDMPSKGAETLFERIKHGELKVDTFFINNSNPTYEYPSCGDVQSIIKSTESIPFSVAITTVMSETASLADIILPTTTYLENWACYSDPSFDFTPFISLAKSVINAPGEAKSIDEILSELLRKTEIPFSEENYQTYITAKLSQLLKNDFNNAYNELQSTGTWISEHNDDPYHLYRSKGFNTQSGKFEIFTRVLSRGNTSGMPMFQPIAEHINLDRNDLILIPYSVNVMTEKLANSKWLSEINHHNSCLINPKTARRLALTNGASVKLISNAGELDAHIRITNMVHPQVIAISRGCGHWEYGNIAQAKKFDSDDPDTELIWWHQKNTGINPNSIIEIKYDAIGNGQAWNDTVVKLTKV